MNLSTSKSLTPFTFEGHQIRVQTDEQGNPWFVAADVCAVLSISDVRQAVERLDEDERGGCQIPTPGGVQEVRAISESGLYTLILRSDKPQAKPFRKWVTSEVLPAIRKTGAYAIPRRNANRPVSVGQKVAAIFRAHAVVKRVTNVGQAISAHVVLNMLEETTGLDFGEMRSILPAADRLPAGLLEAKAPLFDLSQVEDPWTSVIAGYANEKKALRQEFTTNDLLSHVGIDLADRNRSHACRVGQIMRRLDYIPGRQVTIKGIQRSQTWMQAGGKGGKNGN